MASERPRIDGLQLIFSLFLGALLVVVIGVGVWTFYPEPFGQLSPEQQQIDKLYREQERVGGGKFGAGVNTTAAVEAERIQKQIDDLQRKMQKQRDNWARNTSIILLSFATVLMAISLFLPEHMPVFSNGILLGGLFSIIYGTGWSFAGGDSRARFYVVLVALLLTVGIGYLRFIRGRKGVPIGTAPAAAGAGGAVGVGADDLAVLSARVEALEKRAAAAGSALRGGEED